MFSFAKGFLYKFCFCLGLGTATYFSYGQVQKWVTREEVRVVEQVVKKTVSETAPAEGAFYSPQEFSYEQPATAASIVESAAVSESPAPATSEVASTEEKKEEEKKDESAEQKDESNPEVAGGVVVPPQPQGPSMMYAPQVQNEQNQNELAQSNTTSEDRAPAQQIPLLPDALPLSSSSGLVSSGDSSGSSVNSPNPYASGVLSDEDFVALVSPIKASFPDELIEANGLLCVVGGRSCDRRNHVSVHSLRWGMTEGIKKEVAFQIKSVSGNQVEFNFDFKIQNAYLNEETIRLSARPIETLVHYENRDSKSFRVIEFHFSPLSVRGETIRNVQATMVYEITEEGLVLNPDSKLSFSRSKIDLLVSKWEPLAGSPETNGGRSPAQNEVFLIADVLPVSINLEKSP